MCQRTATYLPSMKEGYSLPSSAEVGNDYLSGSFTALTGIPLPLNYLIILSFCKRRYQYKSKMLNKLLLLFD